jgi:DNA-binding NtrC family response regulator
LAGDLPAEVTGNRTPARAEGTGMQLPDSSTPFKDAKAQVLDAFERQYLQDLLIRHKQNISKAAREAGIDRRHLYRLLDKYEIEVKDRGGDD